jgi:16S rRNA (cytosine1402-N4)-methyltransferase
VGSKKRRQVDGGISQLSTPTSRSTPFPKDRHTPVLLDEVIDALDPRRGGLFVDCTVGMGGHSKAILDAGPQARVLGLDRDAESLAIATERLAPFGNRFVPVHADYRDVAAVLARHVPGEQAAGVLADLGISSHQLDEPDRGFSFSNDGPLDMRMDRTSETTAADIVNGTPEGDLADLIYEYGEERASRRIARAIRRAREAEPIATTARLAEIVARASGVPRHKQRVHPATRTFQALRIAVNQELDRLDDFLRDAVNVLAAPAGRIAVIAFHSLEDRIVKQSFKVLSGQCMCPPGFPVCRCGRRRLVRVVTPKPIAPSEQEVEANPRARSARMRVAEREEEKEMMNAE